MGQGLDTRQRAALTLWGIAAGLAGLPVAYLSLSIGLGVPNDSGWLLVLITWPAIVAAFLPFASGATALRAAWIGDRAEASLSIKLGVACALILAVYFLVIWVAIDELGL